MTRIRLNQEYRNKIANRIKVHLQQEDTHEKQTYDNLKGDQIQLNDDAWNMAQKIVRRHYTEDDVEKAWYLQNKFENVNTIAKDSCFHFHYLGTKEDRDYDNNPITKEATIERHFDFRLNGSIDLNNNYSSSREYEYGYALYRDEINAQEDCNADIFHSIVCHSHYHHYQDIYCYFQHILFCVGCCPCPLVQSKYLRCNLLVH